MITEELKINNNINNNPEQYWRTYNAEQNKQYSRDHYDYNKQ